MATRHGMRVLFLDGVLGQAAERIFDLDQSLTRLSNNTWMNFKSVGA
jgi:hypothetical protein